MGLICAQCSDILELVNGVLRLLLLELLLEHFLLQEFKQGLNDFIFYSLQNKFLFLSIQYQVFCLLMGASNTFDSQKMKNQFTNFSSDKWELQSQTTRRQEYGQFNTYRHQITHQQIDKYTLFFHSQLQQKNYYECFLQRLREDYIVNTVYYESKSEKQFCSQTYQGDAYIQHIPVRLCDITDIPFEQFLYMLKLSLIGFQKLYQNVGYFQVKEDLVCIDKQGTVRVWMNCDLSKNYPEGYEKDGEGSRDSERLMVGQIINLIQKNTEDSEGLNVNVSLYFQQNGIKYPTFREAIDLINSYVREYKIRMPTYCESVIEIFRDDYGAQFNVLDSNEDIFIGQNMGSSRSSRQNVLGRDILGQENFDRPSSHYNIGRNSGFNNININVNTNSNTYTSGQNNGVSRRQSNTEQIHHQRSSRSKDSQSRGFFLSDIHENSNEQTNLNQMANPPSSSNKFNKSNSSEQKSSPEFLYPSGNYERSSPRITFSYNGTNFHQYSSESQESIKYRNESSPPVIINKYQNYQSGQNRISQQSQLSSHQQLYKNTYVPPEVNYQVQEQKNMFYEIPEAEVQLDQQIYNDMLKYL